MILIVTSDGYGAGKSTAAYSVMNRYNGVVISLASPIKDIARHFGWDEQKDKRGRKLLQSLGDIGKEYNSNCWIDMWHRELNITRHDLVIVDDVRFMSEYKYIRMCTNSFCHLHITGRGEKGSHISEQQDWSDVSPYIIDNSKFDIITFKMVVESVVKEWIEETRRSYVIED